MSDQSSIIDVALRAWFILTALSVLYVAVDATRRNPEMTVMKWGWVLVTLYTGPIGGALYVLSCQEPRRGSHERFVKPLWKQSLGSTIHCLAGDATGIIAAAVVTMALRLNMAVDLVVEYVFGFAFGLLVFQALFMRQMLGGSYAAALRRSFLPEWISMNAVMAGMVPVMVVLMTRHMSAMEPGSLRFWGVMSLATIIGAAIAYPFNAWLVAANLKHGMGTVRALGEGGHSVHAEAARVALSGSPAPHPAASDPQAAHVSQMNAGIADPPAVTERTILPSATHGGQAASARAGNDLEVGPEAAVTRPQIAAVTLLSLIALGLGVMLGALYGDLTMRGDMAPPASAPMPGMPTH